MPERNIFAWKNLIFAGIMKNLQFDRIALKNLTFGLKHNLIMRNFWSIIFTLNYQKFEK